MLFPNQSEGHWQRRKVEAKYLETEARLSSQIQSPPYVRVKSNAIDASDFRGTLFM